MKYLRTFEIFKKDIYYFDKDDYNYPDGFSRYFKKNDIVVLIRNQGFSNFKVGDKCIVISMRGQNALVKNIRNSIKETMSLNDLLKEEDYELYNITNKYNI